MRVPRASFSAARWLVCTLATLSVFSLRVPAQTNADIGNEYTITTLEVPKGASFSTGDGKLWFLRKDELLRLDADQNRLIPVPIGDIKARSWIVSGGTLWIFGKSEKSWAIRRIDPQTGKLLDTIGLEDNRDQQFLYAYGSIWVWTDFMLAKNKPVLRIDPETKRVIEVSNSFKGQLLASDGKIWMLGVEDGNIKCLDPQSNKVVDEFSVGREHDNGILKGRFKGGHYSYGIGEGALWVLDAQETYGILTNAAVEGPRVKGVLSGYDLKTHERIAKIENDAALWLPMTWKGYVWLSTRGDDRSGHYISRIDPKLQHTVGRLFIPISSKAPRYAEFLPPMLVSSEDSLWAVSGNWFSKNPTLLLRRIQAKDLDNANGEK